ncbi:MAG: helix-turn-helix domain-containing protein [Rhodocyclaceae bacterium]|nr:helix-turn-helix domain-containing protein [Rhodocyclaceae bacterium]
MNLPPPDICYQALLSRDPRFDGRFFVGVRSTGIYCRPICRVRTPKRENCRFFASAEAAEDAGFRPCLRCRPGHAPGRAPIDAGARLARAAAEWIERRLAQEATMDALASHVGVSQRHLRRLFAREFGVTPLAYRNGRRLQLARRLLTESAMPVGEVALAAGFGSLRTFNRSLARAYGQTPGELRQRSPGPGADGEAVFRLDYRPPLDWQALTDFLGRRAIPGVEQVADEQGSVCYRRILRLTAGPQPGVGWIAVRCDAISAALEVRVAEALLPGAAAVLARLRRLFDLACDPHEVASALGDLAAGRPGLRLPGAVDGFEIGVRAVLGQQVSVAAARTLAARFVARFGQAVDTPWPELDRAFPLPAEVAALAAQDFTGIGIMPARANALVALARAVAGGALDLDGLAPLVETRARLLALPGIGPWTADYILMRAASWPDALPEGDVGVHRALGGGSRAAIRQRMAAWRPWRAYAVLHLWMRQEKQDGR